MNFEKLNQAFIVAVNAGVLVSVILLLVELRQSRGIAIAQTRNDIARQVIERARYLASPEIASIFVKRQNQEEVSDVENFQLDRLTFGILQHNENVVYQIDAGMFAAEELAALEERIKDFGPRVLDNYRENKSNYSPAFQRIMTRLHGI